MLLLILMIWYRRFLCVLILNFTHINCMICYYSY